MLSQSGEMVFIRLRTCIQLFASYYLSTMISLFSFFQSCMDLARPGPVEGSAHRHIYYDHKAPILPIMFYRKRRLSPVPHVLQMDPSVKIVPIIQLGRIIVLEFPDGRRQEGFAAGVVNVTPRFCCLALVILVEFRLELMYLGIPRGFLHSTKFPSLIYWRDNEPHWQYLRLTDIYHIAKLTCGRLTSPIQACETFFTNWGMFLIGHQDQVLEPNQVSYAEQPSAHQLVSPEPSFDPTFA